MGEKHSRKSSIDELYRNDGDWEDLYIGHPDKKEARKISEVIRKVTQEKPLKEYVERLSAETQLVSE